MSVVTITLPDDRLAKLQEMAARFGVSLEELARLRFRPTSHDDCCTAKI